MSGHRLHIIEPLKQFTLGDWKIKPFPLKHDVMNLGFLLSRDEYKIVFAVDTNYIPFKFTGLTHILLGVNYDADIVRGKVYRGELNPAVARRSLLNHMSLSTALTFFEETDKSALQMVYLLHLSDANSVEKDFKLEVQKITGVPVIIG